MRLTPYSAADFDHSPFIVFYEITRACDLACAHCRACARPRRHPHELPTEQSRALIDDLCRFDKPPLLVLTGGDPLKREDVYELTDHAIASGLTVTMTPSATPLVTTAAIARLKDAGLSRLAVSLDGVDARTHDGFRNVVGSYDRTLQIMRDVYDVGLTLQVNTTITRRNIHQVDQIAELMAQHQVVLWSVFFLVPVGRGLSEHRISPAEYEQVFARLWHQARTKRFGIKTTEAPHYRRYVLQQMGDPQCNPTGHRGDSVQRAPLGVNDGKGVMFVSHTGQIFPSGFMPIECGRFPENSVVDVYQNHPMMRQLRDADQLEGKCGRCEYRTICGGSRARAFAVSRNPLASEPDCVYQPHDPRSPLMAATV
ncbi:MAG: TIGR04053 family radical SAM/SPASM domain-containing protein [Phycisphaerales bacterium]